MNTVAGGGNSTGFSPPKAESSFELSGSSEASLKPGPRSRGQATITPLVVRTLGVNAPGTQAIDCGAFAKINAKRQRGMQLEMESDDGMEDIVATIRRAISRR